MNLNHFLRASDQQSLDSSTNDYYSSINPIMENEVDVSVWSTSTSTNHIRASATSSTTTSSPPDLPLTTIIKSIIYLVNYCFGNHAQGEEVVVDRQEDEWEIDTNKNHDVFYDVHDELNHEFTTITPPRRLAPSSGGKSVDYSILSIAILTLGLLLVVELILHQLDQLAKERKFFRHVLHTFYRELAILGIVEWFIFILHTYYAGLDIEKESLFAKVHFTLFYTAIFNAITSSILYMGCVANTNRLWVKTEDLEINHYIELREEFERVQFELSDRATEVKAAASMAAQSTSDAARAAAHPHHAPSNRSSQHTFFSTSNVPWLRRYDSTTVEMPFTLRDFCVQLRTRIRHPQLTRRYNKLLVQVRFHELRIHFIEANQLPLKFKVSDYLRKCEQSVLIRLIHVSSFAWIVLMACVNLIYFLMSILVYKAGSLEPTEIAVAVLYYGTCLLFILISLIILQRVKYIFSQIMRMKLVDESPVRDSVILKTHDVTDDANFQLKKQQQHHENEKAAASAAAKQQEKGTGTSDMDMIDGTPFAQGGAPPSSSATPIDSNNDKLAASNDKTNDTKNGDSNNPSFTFSVTSATSQQKPQHKHQHHERPFSQLDLFWFRNPNLIVGAIQFMQFGYAIALSLVIIFWKDIASEYDAGTRNAGVVMSVLCLFCQGLFLFIMAQVIPRFTLCTNLGQLVNRKKLRELMADYHLEEATKRREKQLRRREEEAKLAALLAEEDNHNQKKKRQEEQRIQRRPSSIKSEQQNDRFYQLRELVSKPTKDLPKIAPSASSSSSTTRPRRRRTRAVSDGVAAMRAMSERALNTGGKPSLLSAAADDSGTAVTGAATTSTASAAVGSGVSGGSKDDGFGSSGSSASALTTSSSTTTGTATTSASSRPPRRRPPRKKAVSEGVASMRRLNVGGDEGTATATGILGDQQDSSFGGGTKSQQQHHDDEDDNLQILGIGPPPMSPVLEDIPLRNTSVSKLLTKTVLHSHNEETDPNQMTSPKIEMELQTTPTSSSPSSKSSFSSFPSTPPSARRTGVDSTPDWDQSIDIEKKKINDQGDEVATTPNEDDEDDNGSNPYRSDSDEDDLPEYKREESFIQNKNEHNTDKAVNNKVPLREKIRTFMLSGTFRYLVGIFGTMACFFFVSVRMEMLLVYGPEHIYFPIWLFDDIDPSVFFWLEVTWDCFFMLEGLVMAHVFLPTNERTGRAPMCIAGISGCLLSSLCLVLLLVSEAKRSPTYGPFGSREKAGIGTIEPFTALIGLRFLRYRFGKIVNRWYLQIKGINVLEHLKPSASLPDHSFAHHTSKESQHAMYMAQHHIKANTTTGTSSGALLSSSQRMAAAYVHPASKEILSQTGTTIELWRMAVALFPDIVDEYGEFSGELLQAMLGIPLIPDLPSSDQERKLSSSGGGRRASTSRTDFGSQTDKEQTTNVTTGTRAEGTGNVFTFDEGKQHHGTDELGARGGGQGDESTTSHRDDQQITSPTSMKSSASKLRFDKAYTKLAPEIQAIIFAGKLGQPVRCISTSAESPDQHYHHQQQQQLSPHHKGTRTAENSDNEDAGYSSTDSNRYLTFRRTVSQGVAGEGSGDGRSSTSPAVNTSTTFSTTDAKAKHAIETTFEVDNKAILDEEKIDMGNASILLEPNAPLIRSMRRCERRLPPILNHWAIVDVVMTEYEIVYFDAMGVDEHDAFHSSFLPKGVANKRNAVRHALIATKGGKKLRLRDVASGRKIVGHVDVRKIDLVKVLRHSPLTSPEGAEDVYHVQSEYWKPSDQQSSDPFLVKEANRKRWERAQEDNLQIHSAQGVLYLRFFSDLDTYESKVGTLAIVSPPPGTHHGKETSSDEPLALLWAQTIGRLCGTHQLKQNLPHFGQERTLELADYVENVQRSGEGGHTSTANKNWTRLKRAWQHRGSMMEGNSSAGGDGGGNGGGEEPTPKDQRDSTAAAAAAVTVDEPVNTATVPPPPPPPPSMSPSKRNLLNG